MIIFDVEDYRAMHRLCAEVTRETTNPDLLQYIDLQFSNDNPDEVVAYASNTFQVHRITLPVIIDQKHWGHLPEHLFIMPGLRLLKGVHTVTLDWDDKEYHLRALTVDGTERSAFDAPMMSAVGMNYQSLERKVIDDISHCNHGDGQYSIVVNPKYLMEALNGLKTCDMVVLNFGDPNKPFIVRPYANEYFRACAIVYPIRTHEVR